MGRVLDEDRCLGVVELFPIVALSRHVIHSRISGKNGNYLKITTAELQFIMNRYTYLQIPGEAVKQALLQVQWKSKFSKGSTV